MLPGRYYCFVRASKGNVVYETNKLFQVVSGENKQLVLSPMENVGSLTIQRVNPYVNHLLPLPGLHVALVSERASEYSKKEMTVGEIESMSWFTSVSDVNGKVCFEKVPVGTYFALGYDPVVNKVYADSFIWVDNLSSGEDRSCLLNCFHVQL